MVELLSHCEKQHKENLGKDSQDCSNVRRGEGFLLCGNHTAYDRKPTHSLLAGTQTFRFSSLTEFLQWKDHEEEGTYTTYIKGDRIYCPKSINKSRSPLMYVVYAA